MWGTSIAGRVKKVIAQRVRDAQKEHDEKKIALEAEKEKKIEEHAEEMVSKIIGR